MPLLQACLLFSSLSAGRLFLTTTRTYRNCFRSYTCASPHVLGARLVPFVARITVLKVVLHWTDDVTDPQHAASLDALRRLEGFEDARGRPLKVRHFTILGEA